MIYHQGGVTVEPLYNKVRDFAMEFEMKDAYRQIRIAEIYARRVDWVMSGDDGEDDLQERLSKDLEAFEKELQAKDWACSYEGDED